MSCASNKKNLGFSKCNDLPKQFRGQITTPMGFKLTAEEAADPAAWQAALLANPSIRIYKWPNLVAAENASTDAVYEESPLATIFVDPGKYQWRLSISKDLCTHKAAFSHSGSDQRVIFFDGIKLFLMEDADGNVMGFPVGILQTEKLIISDGSVATKSPIFVSLANSYDVDQSAVTLPAPWYSNLIPLTDVTVTVVPPTADDSLKVLITATCDGTPIVGLLMADFVVKTTLGANQALTSAIPDPSIEGQYTLVGTADFVSGTVNLRSASLLTVKGYESTGPATFTVS